MCSDIPIDHNPRETITLKLSSKLLAVSIMSVAISCGEENGDSGVVVMQMTNQTTTALQGGANNQNPSYFGLKIMSVSLRYTADLNDSNASPVYESGIYIAPTGCTNGGKSDIERDGKKYEYYQPPGPDFCTTSEMEYVDLARTTEEVNATINAAQYPVLPGEYNQVTICFASTYSFAVEEYLTASSELNISSDTISEFGCEDKVLENFQIAEGETATVSLDYDLANGAIIATEVPTAHASGSTNCVESDKVTGTYICLNSLNPTPSASK